jgi:hypothetical protein
MESQSSKTETERRKSSLHSHGPILHVMCIGFHHREGPIVEEVNPDLPIFESEPSLPRSSSSSSLPVLSIDLPAEWSHLPFICLPDGSHSSKEDFIFFHLPPVPSWDKHYHSTIFGLGISFSFLMDRF